MKDTYNFIQVDGTRVMSVLYGVEEKPTGVNGFLVGDIPTPNVPQGKDFILRYNSETGELYYEYIDAPMTYEQEILKEIDKLKEEIAEKDKRIDSLETDLADLMFEFAMGGMI